MTTTSYRESLPRLSAESYRRIDLDPETFNLPQTRASLCRKFTGNDNYRANVKPIRERGTSLPRKLAPSRTRNNSTIMVRVIPTRILLFVQSRGGWSGKSVRVGERDETRRTQRLLWLSASFLDRQFPSVALILCTGHHHKHPPSIKHHGT